MCELRSARAGVEEITYYTALANLLDEVGKTLKGLIIGSRPRRFVAKLRTFETRRR